MGEYPKELITLLKKTSLGINRAISFELPLGCYTHYEAGDLEKDRSCGLCLYRKECLMLTMQKRLKGERVKLPSSQSLNGVNCKCMIIDEGE